MEIGIKDYEKYKSAEEIYMAWWLEDAVNHGIVFSWEYEPEGWTLCDQHDIIVTKHKSNKAKTPYSDTKILVEKQTYTCDFKIIWNREYDGIFYKIYGGLTIKDQTPYFYARMEEFVGVRILPVTYIDIKPGFAQASQQSFVRFPVKQAWVYDKYGVYVQKIVTLQSVKYKLSRKYSGLFVDTFVPEKWLLTDGGTQKRKINFNYKLITDYVIRKTS